LKPIFENLDEVVSYGEIRMSLTIILKNEKTDWDKATTLL
jgi:ATP-dependent DNA helicase RecQ